jgi:Tfp pilus assembly protein PilF/DNA-binding transcriptional ArsR family regulator
MMKSPTIFSFTPSLMNPVDLESIFVQREAIAADLVERIRESVLTPTKHHSLIVGARGMGKTHLVSLVYHRVQAMADLQEQILIAWLREEEWGITSFLKLLLRILRAIDPSDPAIQQRIEALYKLSSAEAEQAAMSLLTEIIGDRTLLLITENIYDLFKGLGEQGQQQLRAFLQNSGCCTILATSQYIFKGVQSRIKPFYGFFRPVHLQTLKVSEGVQLLSRIASLRGQKELVSFLQTPAGISRVRTIQHLIGGNPRFYVVFSEFLSRESLEDLLQPFMELLDALTPYYQSRMMYLSMQQREIIAFLGDRKYPATVRDIAQICFITSQTTSSQLKELKEKGYVNVESIGRESFYTLKEPLMRIFLGLKKARDSKPIESMIDFLRVWYSKTEIDLLKQKISDEFIREHLELALPDSIDSKQDQRISVFLDRVKDCYDPDILDKTLQYIQKRTIIGSADDWIQQALSQIQLDQFTEAIISCENALAIEVDNYNAWYLRGCCLGGLSRYREEAVSYFQAIYYQPDFYNAYYNLGIVLGQLGHYEEAISTYDIAINLKPDFPQAWNNRGTSFAKLGNYKDALTCVERAIEIDPNHIYALGSQAELLLATNRWNEGLEAMKDILNRFQQSNKSYPGNIELVLKGLLQQDSSQWQSKITDLISWFEPFPTAVTNGLVSACKKLISPLISDTTAILWHDTWRELTHHLPEYQLPLRLLTTALHYKQKPDDPRVWMELSIEERKILQQALGLDSIESRD